MQLLGRGDELAREGLAGLHEQISARSSASGTTNVPASFTSVTLKTSPSFTFTVMKMSSFSGAIATCVDSTCEVRVAAVHVVRAQLLEVALQRLARVAVVLLVPGQPVRRLQLELLEQLFVGERCVADDVDLADLGALAFVDVDLDLDPVAGHFLDLGIDAHARTCRG